MSVVPVGSPGNVRVYPANATTPNTSVISFVSGLNFSNALTVGTYYAAGPQEIEVYVGNASAHVIADVMDTTLRRPCCSGRLSGARQFLTTRRQP
jgi:hypothetical protein